MVAVLSMSKQEFSRLAVLLRVRSGSLRINRGRPNNLKLPAEVRRLAHQVARGNFCFLHPEPSRPSATGCRFCRNTLWLTRVVQFRCYINTPIKGRTLLCRMCKAIC